MLLFAGDRPSGPTRDLQTSVKQARWRKCSRLSEIFGIADEGHHVVGEFFFAAQVILG
jgi:hypothetical protein